MSRTTIAVAVLHLRNIFRHLLSHNRRSLQLYKCRHGRCTVSRGCCTNQSDCCQARRRRQRRWRWRRYMKSITVRTHTRLLILTIDQVTNPCITSRTSNLDECHQVLYSYGLFSARSRSRARPPATFTSSTTVINDLYDGIRTGLLIIAFPLSLLPY